MRIGIIGGAGALATSKFFNDLLNTIARTTNPSVDSDYPEILLSNLPILNGDYTASFSKSQVEDFFTRGVRTLGLTETDLIVVPCNSIQRDLPRGYYTLVDNVQATLDRVRTPQSLVLASRKCNEESVWGVDSSPLTEELQDCVDELIQRGISGKTYSELPKALVEYLELLPATTTVVLGCTELSLFRQQFKSLPIQLIDSTLSVAEEAVDIWRSDEVLT